MQQLADTLHATLIPKGSLGLKAGLLVDGKGDFFASHGHFGEYMVS
jgi:hypothetical protein